MKLLPILCIMLCLISYFGKAQSIKLNKKSNLSSITWGSDECEYKGKYDPKKFTIKQLENTYKLCWGLSLQTKVTAFAPDDVLKLNPEKLKEEYNSKKKIFRTMEIIKTPFWENLKKRREKEFDEEYELKKIAVEAYTNPMVLRNNKFSKHCENFVNPLSSGDSLVILDSWIKFELAREKNFGNNWALHLSNVNYQYYSPQRLQYATCNLITLGWWNCAVNLLNHYEYNSKMENEFRKNFTQIKEKCDYLD